VRVDRNPINGDPLQEFPVAPAPGGTLIDGRRCVPDVVNNIIGTAATQTGRGYWLVGNDGRVFAFGDARFYGSLPDIGVHVANIVAIAASKSGRGYWLIGSDGEVFAFGDAPFYGSPG
jgi:hypothetical protein